DRERRQKRKQIEPERLACHVIVLLFLPFLYWVFSDPTRQSSCNHPTSAHHAQNRLPLLSVHHAVPLNRHHALSRCGSKMFPEARNPVSGTVRQSIFGENRITENALSYCFLAISRRESPYTFAG